MLYRMKEYLDTDRGFLYHPFTFLAYDLCLAGFPVWSALSSTPAGVNLVFVGTSAM